MNYPITQKGMKNLQDTIQELMLEKDTIIEEIKRARSYGDLSENAEYTVAKDKQRMNNAKLGELQSILSSAKIINYDDISNKTVVNFGATVVLKSSNTNKTKQFVIVNSFENDFTLNKISIDTPMAKKLINNSVGTFINLPPNDEEFEIINIHYDELK